MRRRELQETGYCPADGYTVAELVAICERLGVPIDRAYITDGGYGPQLRYKGRR